jgi:hypothetical protein
MIDRSLSLQVNPLDAPVLQSLMAHAESIGKSVAEMFQELKDHDRPLALKVNDEQVVMVLDEDSYTRLVNDARQNEKEKLRQLLLEGLNSEAVSMKQADWDAMREEVKRRAEHSSRS